MSTSPSWTPAEDRAGAYVGMVVFLASWGMMFATLFLAYVVLRVQQTMWPPLGVKPLPLPLAVISTSILLASSGTLIVATRRIRAGLGGYGAWLTGTLLLGILFLAMQWKLWSSTWASGIEPAHGSFGSVFYGLTVFHALHVVAGLVALLWLAVRARRGEYGPQKHVPVLVVSMFWHFLDVVWISMFAAIFLW